MIDFSKNSYNGMLINFPKSEKSEKWDESDLTVLTPNVVDFFLRRFSKTGDCAVFIRCGSGNGALAAVYQGVHSVSMDTCRDKVDTLFL